MDKIEKVLTRSVEKIYPNRRALEKVLRSGKKIRLYQGFDPSMPSLHLGNMVGVLKLKQFQDLGHEVIFLVGDFTGMIGDPTDKSAARPQLTRKQVLKNCQNWQKQVGKILKFSGKNPARLLYNSSWLAKLSFVELVKLAHHLTYQQTIKRNMFQKRLKQNKNIYLHEFLYPLMQAYDSVAMNVDLEIGGSDQTFNMLVGRDLMHKLKKREKFVLTMKLLVDSKGEKVGKTAGNALFLTASPGEMYGAVMSFPDETIVLAFELLTLVPLQAIKEHKKSLQSKKTNPMILKKALAYEIVKMYHGTTAAKKAQIDFERAFEKNKPPLKIPTASFPTGKWLLADLLVKTKQATSKAQAKRLIRQGAVDLDGQPVLDIKAQILIKNKMVIRTGKHRFVKIKLNEKKA